MSLFARDRDIRPIEGQRPRLPATEKPLPPLTVRHSRKAATKARRKSSDTHAALNLLKRMGW